MMQMEYYHHHDNM